MERLASLNSTTVRVELTEGPTDGVIINGGKFVAARNFLMQDGSYPSRLGRGETLPVKAKPFLS